MYFIVHVCLHAGANTGKPIQCLHVGWWVIVPLLFMLIPTSLSKFKIIFNSSIYTHMYILQAYTYT